MKKNTNMKEDLDYIRQKYGSVAEIKQKMDIAEMKEKKIDELVSNLSTSIVSIFDFNIKRFCHYQRLLKTKLAMESLSPDIPEKIETADSP